jgi:SUMO ligase MMS21 Smc5/6 complex component
MTSVNLIVIILLLAEVQSLLVLGNTRNGDHQQPEYEHEDLDMKLYSGSELCTCR